MTLNLRRTIGPTDKKVFLAGEGPNELGGFAHKIEYRNEEPGILEILLRKVKAEGWMICGAKSWKEIKKYRAGEHLSAEERNVLGICYEAKRNGYDVIAFSRDSDGKRERVTDIQNGIQSATLLWPDQLGIIGGCAVPCIEGWVLAILGNRHTESSSRARIEAQIIDSGIKPKKTTEMVEKIEQHGLANVPDDACSLTDWLESAREKLSSTME
jgi:hypothetical protein